MEINKQFYIDKTTSDILYYYAKLYYPYSVFYSSEIRIRNIITKKFYGFHIRKFMKYNEKK
jgi:hypothetical protein